jgi:hypothetical protein
MQAPVSVSKSLLFNGSLPLITLSIPRKGIFPLPTSAMAASPAENSKRLEEAEKLTKSDPAKAEEIYKSITQSPGSNVAAMNNLEVALVGLGELYRDQKRVDELANLILQTREALSSFAKAKVAKLGEYQHNYSDILLLIFSPQSGNYLIYSPPYLIPLKPKYPSRNNASNGP